MFFFFDFTLWSCCNADGIVHCAAASRSSVLDVAVISHLDARVGHTSQVDLLMQFKKAKYRVSDQWLAC